VTGGVRRPAVLLVHDSYRDYVTGLANALAERVPVTLLHSTSAHEWMRPGLSDAVRVVVHPHRRVRDPRRFTSTPAVADVAASVGADVVHLQQSTDPVFNLVQLRRRPRLPQVMTVHDVAPHPGDRTSVPGGQLTLRAQRARIDRYITHAAPLREELARRWRLPTERIDVVAHGELGGLYRRYAEAAGPTPAEQRSGGPEVLFFGRVWPYKGLDRLIAAMNVLAESRPGLVLTIAGEGQSLDGYLAAVRPPLAVQVLNRYIGQAEVAGLFTAADVVCLPYLEASQSGVHALACGLGVPVVASAVGGLSSAVRDGEDGVLVPPGDVPALIGALDRVLGDPALRARLSAGALARAAGDLSWDAVADATLEVYARACSGRR
jgi:glycosyltransferase involved in cell wall biosynthesis